MTVNVAGNEDPNVGDTFSQAPPAMVLDRTLKVNALLATTNFSVWAAGVVPATALKLKPDGVAVTTTGVTVKVNLVEPPTPGLETVTCAVPGTAMSSGWINALNWVGLKNCVLREDPFHSTTEFEKKFVPVTVRLKEKDPAAMPVVESALIVGRSVPF